MVKGNGMTYDDFLQRNKRNTDMLDKIARRTEAMALSNCANSSNAEFVAIMQLQEKVFMDTEKLLNEFENPNTKEHQQ